MVVPRFVQSALKNEPITIYGDGTQSRVFCHVLDAIDATLKITKDDKTIGEVFNVGGEGETTIQQLAEKKWGTREAVAYTVACVATALLSAPTWVSAKVFADWAARAPHGLFNDGFLTHHLDAIGFAWSPFSQPYIDGFAGQGFMF